LGGKPAVMGKLMAQIKEEKNEQAEFFMENSDLNSLSPEFVSWNGNLALMQIGKIEHTMEAVSYTHLFPLPNVKSLSSPILPSIPGPSGSQA